MKLGITMGDASGVGPEIILKTYARGKLPRGSIVVGDLSILDYCNTLLKYNVPLKSVSSFGNTFTGVLNVFDMKLLAADDLEPGKRSKKSGFAAFKYLERTLTAALDKQISALVTLPMNKEATRLSVHDFTGHTEVIVSACGGGDYTMTLISDTLIVCHVTAHMSLKNAIASLTPERILKVINLASTTTRKLKRNNSIAVMGLNPHAGEHGAFGDEESSIISPAVELAKKTGVDIVGPLPPDTTFMRAHRGEFGAIVCMYHDQGHIPMKMIGFDTIVQATIGLPIVRTSVDHGTAFDIAYKGTASIGSFVNACKLAKKLAR